MKYQKVFFPKVIKKYKVASKSEKGTFHLVEMMSDKSFRCDCIAGSMKRDCRHKRRVLNYLKGFYYEKDN